MIITVSQPSVTTKRSITCAHNLNLFTQREDCEWNSVQLHFGKMGCLPRGPFVYSGLSQMATRWAGVWLRSPGRLTRASSPVWMQAPIITSFQSGQVGPHHTSPLEKIWLLTRDARLHSDYPPSLDAQAPRAEDWSGWSSWHSWISYISVLWALNCFWD